MKVSIFLSVLISLSVPDFGLAQHEHHAPPASPTPAPTPPPAPTPGTPAGSAPDDSMKGMDHSQMKASTPPSSDTARNLFQSDMSLMTGMTPRDPMSEMTGMAGWHLMDMGIARISFNRQGGDSGGSAVESNNWNMIHAQHALGRGRLSLMMMNSLEPATYAKLGSRELFQTGESYRGQPLVDRQHPHDFFMNLSATYRLDLGPESGAWLQLAPVGEPALGPVAFMHRASSGENGTAPLGHHWQDSTHIAFNVITAGAGWKWIAVEGSAFHGREPDEHRWDIEGGSVDSASGRANFFFGGGWSAQVSYGFVKSPEALQPGNTHRTTAALFYGADGDRPFAATILWGRNVESHGTSDAWLLEGAYQLTAEDQIYGRAELVQKDFVLLATKRLSESEHAGTDLVRVGAYTLGYLRDFPWLRKLKTGLGADVTAYSFPSSLRPVYGRFPLSVHAFLRLRWGAPHSGGAHDEHSGMKM
ncbi:MAG: hypothetical protein M3167_00810 [Acidobacteriota bacterium]|nr:hypothetical protein [Acidobacteriota bacterium]